MACGGAAWGLLRSRNQRMMTHDTYHAHLHISSFSYLNTHLRFSSPLGLCRSRQAQQLQLHMQSAGEVERMRLANDQLRQQWEASARAASDKEEKMR